VGVDTLHSRETTAAPGHPGPPIVFLHGIGTTSRYTRPLLHALDGRAVAAAVELPGIGGSTGRSIPTDIAGQADVIARWLEATRRRPVVLVGNSMGGQTAVEVAVRHPALVHELVLIGPTVDRAARGLLPQAWKLLVDATVERPRTLAVTLTDPSLTRRRAVHRNVRAALAHRIEERIGRVAAPVRVVRGEHDPLVPRRWAAELASRAPVGRWVEVAGGAHACHHGHPELVADLLCHRA
jgi:pimeloyl-ACP methyl ester carboxylesterase